MRFGVYLTLALAIASPGYAQTSRGFDQPDNDSTPSQGGAARDDGTNQNEYAPPDGSIENFLDTLIGNSQHSYPYSDPESYREAQRADEDLEAQRDMALWAQRMFWITLGSVVVTFFGVVLVFFTLRETRKATLAATDAAKAAEDAVTIARELGERQIRAYVGVIGVACIGLKTGETLHVQATIRNSGQSPAFGLRQVITWKGVEKAIDPEFDFTGMYEGGSEATIQAGDKIGTGGPFLIHCSADFVEGIMSGQDKMIVAGQIKYRDVCGVDRETVYRMRLLPGSIEDGNGWFVAEATGNDST